jgi:ribosomal protein S18 acetylase RimI-like enzyme
MAALPDRYTESLIDLRELSAEHLAPLLQEEITAWHSGLDWDFSASADLVRRFVHLRALNGFALMGPVGVTGYSYYVAEEGKGLIGDFFVRASERTPESEHKLLNAVLDSMFRTPGIRRVEAQLMMLGGDLTHGAPYPRWFHSYPRKFMEVPLSADPPWPARESPNTVFSPWTENRQDDAARLIATAYRSHVDSQINDQYRSPAGARRFLANIVQYPGCGSFFAPASFGAWDRADRTVCGVSLASLVAAETGHITQICVAPSHQGRGIGYELLRRSLTALAAHGCRRASLTVTSANESAVQLYERMGFRNRRDFSASVWEIR